METEPTLDELQLTPRQMRIIKAFCGDENVTLPIMESQNSYWRLVAGEEPSRLGLLTRVEMQGDRIGFRLTEKGRQILAKCC